MGRGGQSFEEKNWGGLHFAADSGLYLPPRKASTTIVTNTLQNMQLQTLAKTLLVLSFSQSRADDEMFLFTKIMMKNV